MGCMRCALSRGVSNCGKSSRFSGAPPAGPRPGQRRTGGGACGAACGAASPDGLAPYGLATFGALLRTAACRGVPAINTSQFFYRRRLHPQSAAPSGVCSGLTPADDGLHHAPAGDKDCAFRKAYRLIYIWLVSQPRAAKWAGLQARWFAHNSSALVEDMIARGPRPAKLLLTAAARPAT
jgi:hypothetical protein